MPVSGDKFAILEAEVEGIGKAVIEGQTIRVKLPAGYSKSTVRLDYTVTENVKVIVPASGSDLPIRDVPSRTICIKQDEYGNCQLSYRLIIETQSPLTVLPEPATLQLELAQFYQPYELHFKLGNLKTATPVTRRFEIRFVNKATGYSYTGDNYMVYDLAGQPVFVNHADSPPVPNEGTLRMTGTLPLGMGAGAYTVTIQVPTCYSPDSRGGCSQFGYEAVELATPLLIKAGPPLVGITNSSPSANREILITGRNFVSAKTVSVNLTNDFTPAVVAPATVLNDTLARLVLPAGQSVGQYQLEVAPEGGKTHRALFTVPSAQSSSSLSYVASQSQYTATMNWFPTLPVFRRGESLEVQYVFTAGDLSYLSLGRRTVRHVRMTHTATKQAYDLKAGGAFNPFVAAPDFFLWKWTLPATLPAGEYTLAFEDFDGSVSLPYYRKIRIE